MNREPKKRFDFQKLKASWVLQTFRLQTPGLQADRRWQSSSLHYVQRIQVPTAHAITNNTGCYSSCLAQGGPDLQLKPLKAGWYHFVPPSDGHCFSRTAYWAFTFALPTILWIKHAPRHRLKEGQVTADPLFVRTLLANFPPVYLRQQRHSIIQISSLKRALNNAPSLLIPDVKVQR